MSNLFLTRKYVAPIIGIIAFLFCAYYVLTNFKWIYILNTLQEANWLLFISGGIITNIIFFLIRSLRWYCLLRSLNVQVPFWRLYFCNAAVVCLTIATPAQSGEVLKVELLKQITGIDRFSGYASFAIERLADLVSILSIAVISISTLASFPVKTSVVIYVWLFLLFGVTVVITSIKNAGNETYLGQLIQPLKSCENSLSSLLNLLLLTIAAWCIVAVGWWIALKSVAINLSWIETFALLSVTSIVSILSFVPGAIGVSEVTVSESLQHFSVDPATAQVGALALRLNGLLIILASTMHWLYWKMVDYRRIKRTSKS